MALSARFFDQHRSTIANNWWKFLLWGVVLLALGLTAIGAAAFTTMLSVVFIGCIIFFSGAIMLADTATFWWGKWSSFIAHTLLVCLYLWVGYSLITNPVSGSMSLTLLLGIFYVVIGLCRMGLSTALKLPQWGFGFANGVVSLLLGVLILAGWPDSSLFIIGLFVGIDLAFLGLSYIMLALTARTCFK